jgi:hypothetical protein
LAVAALTELGGSRGNPLEVANRMLPIFGELRVTLANNLADDNLLMIAAYDQGKAGKFKDLRNTLEALARKIRTSARAKSARSGFSKAGQNHRCRIRIRAPLSRHRHGNAKPKDFGVNSEAVVFN